MKFNVIILSLLLVVAPLCTAATGAAVTSIENSELLLETTQRVNKLPGKRRAGATKALNLVQSRSPELCKLTGLEYMPVSELNDSVQASIDEDGEELSEDVGMEGDDEVNYDELAGDYDADEEEIDLESFRSMWLNYVNPEGDDITEAGVERQHLVNIVLDWLGTRYRFGGVTRRGIDCSAFTRMVYRETINIELPRTANVQATLGENVKSIDELEFGDLVLFHTRRYARVTHIGVYLGDKLFAHASSRYGVTISSLESGYYNDRFVGGVHLTQRDVAQLASEQNPDEAGL